MIELLRLTLYIMALPGRALEKRRAQSRDTLPTTRPEGGEVRGLVSPRIVIETRPRPALGRLLMPARLSGVSIHRRLALSGLGGCGVSIRRRYVTRRLDRGRLDVDHVTRPAEIVGPSARRRERLTFGEHAGHGCAGGSGRSGAAAPEQFFRHNARFPERHDRPGCRPLRRTALFGIRRLRARTDRHRQRDRHALVPDDALDFALDVMGELTRTELRKIDTVARAQAARLS